MSVKLTELREPLLEAKDPRLEARDPLLLPEDIVRVLADRLQQAEEEKAKKAFSNIIRNTSTGLKTSIQITQAILPVFSTMTRRDDLAF